MRRTEQVQGLSLMKFEEIYERPARRELSQVEAASILGVSERAFCRFRAQETDVTTNPFRLKKTIGNAYTMYLDDSLNTKRALSDLGYLKTPDFGLTPYPDKAMVDGVKFPA